MPSRSLHSASESHFIIPSQRGIKSLSLTFKLNVPSWWNDLPNSIRAAESLAIFKKRLKHISSIFISTLALSVLILTETCYSTCISDTYLRRYLYWPLPVSLFWHLFNHSLWQAHLRYPKSVHNLASSIATFTCTQIICYWVMTQ